VRCGRRAASRCAPGRSTTISGCAKRVARHTAGEVWNARWLVRQVVLLERLPGDLTAPPQRQQRLSVGDGIQPTTRALFIGWIVKWRLLSYRGAPRGDKRVLDDVAGQLTIRHHATHERMKLSFMPFQQARKPGHQRWISGAFSSGLVHADSFPAPPDPATTLSLILREGWRL
jgi:hypothetical protein